MNEVELKKELKYKRGSFFKAPICEIYILAQIEYEKFVAISLKDGHYWDVPNISKEGAVEGLDFIASDVKIIIEL